MLVIASCVGLVLGGYGACILLGWVVGCLLFCVVVVGFAGFAFCVS